MNHILLIRILLDFVGVGLFLAALAYWWLDNLSHEVVGSGLFALLIVHNVFNRRWYGALSKTTRQPRARATVAINLALLAAILTLVVTSVVISRSVFVFLPLSGGGTARQIHILAAYWVMIVVAVHLGMHWLMIMTLARSRLGVTTSSVVRTATLRFAALAIAAIGVYSALVLDIGSKLVGRVTMEFWDFNEFTIRFFAYHGVIMAGFAVVTHYILCWCRNAQRSAQDQR